MQAIHTSTLLELASYLALTLHLQALSSSSLLNAVLHHWGALSVTARSTAAARVTSTGRVTVTVVHVLALFTGRIG